MKTKKKEKINYLHLLLPGLFILINWIVLKNATNETMSIYLIIDTIVIIVLAFLNNNKFTYTLISILIFSLINYVPASTCSDSGWFPCMYESIVMFLNYVWFTIYLIVYGIRCLIKNKGT